MTTTMTRKPTVTTSLVLVRGRPRIKLLCAYDPALAALLFRESGAGPTWLIELARWPKLRRQLRNEGYEVRGVR